MSSSKPSACSTSANRFASNSIEQLVNQARTDLKKSTPGLPDLDLEVRITDQAGIAGTVELRIETTFAYS